MKKAIIVGCTSGIGRALSEVFVAQGYKVAGLARNTEVLQDMEQNLNGQFIGHPLDVRDLDAIAPALDEVAARLGGVDVCVMAASIARKNAELEWETEWKVLQTNVMGYARVLIWAARYFLRQGHGHLVGISSLAKYLGGRNPAYTASKAFEGIYLDGLRLKLERKGIWVTEIMPGFVRTPLTEDQPNVFWAISPQKAAQCIFKAIRKRKRRAVVSLRWKPFRCLIPHLPFALLKRFL